jgi:predicted metal-dependent hydrolase
MKVRKPDFNFSLETPAHWLGGSPFKTHLCNSFTLLFPAGEKFFIRSVQKLMPEIKDERLKAEARLFIKQEAQHYLEHEKFFQVLKAQGYDIDKILNVVDGIIENITTKRLSPHMGMSITAGCEHITALLSEIALTDNFFKDAPDDMRALFEWHSGEELEHRSVAFDVLMATDSNYAHRVIGIITAYIFFSAFTAYITCALMWQDKTLLKTRSVKDAMAAFFFENKLFPKALAIFVRYLLPDFHPSRYSELETLAESVFNRYSGMEMA